MRTGRPPSADRKRLPELEPISTWFEQAIEEVGHGSIRRTAQMTGLSQQALYQAVNAERMLPQRVVRALAEGLGREPAEIDALWAAAKQQRDRVEDADRRRSHPAPTTWADIPSPGPSLRDLLEAQDGTLDCLPYSLLGLVEPPLSAVYVRQRVRLRTADGQDAAAGSPPETVSPGRDAGAGAPPRPQDGLAGTDPRPARDSIAPSSGAAHTSAADPVISLSDALARYDHLLITGEAGAGKSTLASHLVRSLCGVWLRRCSIQDAPVAEPLVPLCLSASVLAAENGSWSERLRRAALGALGAGLVADPPGSLFSGRPQGARWLIFVDGLDEVTDRRQRAELIRTLARHSSRDSDFRLVVTSRPLPTAELAPLHGARLGEFEIQPFGRAELTDYARNWFDQQRTRIPNPAAAASRFLSEVVETGHLSELVGNPLLATLALVNATLEPLLPPPANRLALYGTFLERLAERTGNSAKDPFPGWLAEHADALVRALALARTEGREDLVGAAREWLRQRPDSRVPLPAGWEEELPSTLVGTGLLVTAGDHVRFLHQSFAEFLAALEYAEAVPADSAGPELETWIRRTYDGDRQSLALFVLCRWAARSAAGPGLVIDRLLDYPYADRTLLAGTLLTEGVDADDEHTAKVIRRLGALVRGDDLDRAGKAADALSALRTRHDTVPLLSELAIAPGLRTEHRFVAVSALSRVAPPEVTGPLLAALMEGLYGTLPKAARLGSELGGSSGTAIRQRLADLLAEPDANHWEQGIAAETYRVLGATEEVSRLARLVLADPTATRQSIRQATVAWLGPDPSTEVTAQIAAAGADRPAVDHAGRMTVAGALQDAGASAEAAELARAVLDDPCLTAWPHPTAATLWLRVRGAAEADPVRRYYAHGCEVGWEIWQQSRCLQAMVDAGVECEAGEWADEVLSGAHHLPLGTKTVMDLWLTVKGQKGPAELSALIGPGTRLHAFERADYARILLDGGLTDQAAPAALLAIRASGSREVDYEGAAGVLLRIDQQRAVKILERQLDDGPDTAAWCSGVLDALLKSGFPEVDDLALRIAGYALDLPGAQGSQVATTIAALTTVGGPGHRHTAAEAVRRHPELSLVQRRVATQSFAALGLDDLALANWRYLLSIRGRSSDGSGLELLEDIAQAFGHAKAAQLLDEQLATNPPPFQRRQLERLTTWLTCSPSRV
jgi:hypothetical protein